MHHVFAWVVSDFFAITSEAKTPWLEVLRTMADMSRQQGPNGAVRDITLIHKKLHAMFDIATLAKFSGNVGKQLGVWSQVHAPKQEG